MDVCLLIKKMLELWVSSLRDVKARMRPLLTQDRVVASAENFLDGILGGEGRKHGSRQRMRYVKRQGHKCGRYRVGRFHLPEAKPQWCDKRTIGAI